MVDLIGVCPLLFPIVSADSQACKMQDLTPSFLTPSFCSLKITKAKV